MEKIKTDWTHPTWDELVRRYEDDSGPEGYIVGRADDIIANLEIENATLKAIAIQLEIELEEYKEKKSSRCSLNGKACGCGP